MKQKENIRVIIEKREMEYLSEFAFQSINTFGRERTERKDFFRTEYMRDRDRIIHSEAFRRLKNKTSVFLSTVNDVYRTRLSHTLEVSQIARTISRALNLNEDLTEAIALGHDVGHTPFGHSGEDAIRKIGIADFKHSTQSVRVLSKLEKNFHGLNLTKEVLDGIEKHSKTGKKNIFPENDSELPMSLEAEVVRISDIIAYVNHDIEDAVQSGILHNQELPKSSVKRLGSKHSTRINCMVQDVYLCSVERPHISMSSEVLTETQKLRDFLFENVYHHPKLEEESVKAKNILTELYVFLSKNIKIVYNKMGLKKQIWETESENRWITDFLALMTDNEAMKMYIEVYIPRSFFVI